METIVELTSLLSKLQGSLDPHFHELETELGTKINFLMERIGQEEEITALCSVYNLLNEEKNIASFQPQKRKLIEEANILILSCINNYFIKAYNPDSLPSTSEPKKKNSHFKILLFLGMAFLGTIFAGVEGASAIESIMVTFTSLSSIPMLILIPTQIVFASFGVMIFYALELNSIGKPLGIRALDLGKIFKLYAKQLNLYNEVISNIDLYHSKVKLNPNELTKFKSTYRAVEAIHENLTYKINCALETHNKPAKTKSLIRASCFGVSSLVGGTLWALGAKAFASAMLPFIIGASAAAGPAGLGITIGLMTLFFLFAVIMQKKGADTFFNKLWGVPTKAINSIADDQKLIEKTKGKIKDMTNKEESYHSDVFKNTLKADSQRIDNFSQWQHSKQEATVTIPSNRFSTILSQKMLGQALVEKTLQVPHSPVEQSSTHVLEVKA